MAKQRPELSGGRKPANTRDRQAAQARPGVPGLRRPPVGDASDPRPIPAPFMQHAGPVHRPDPAALAPVEEATAELPILPAVPQPPGSPAARRSGRPMPGPRRTPADERTHGTGRKPVGLPPSTKGRTRTSGAVLTSGAALSRRAMLGPEKSHREDPATGAGEPSPVTDSDAPTVAIPLPADIKGPGEPTVPQPGASRAVLPGLALQPMVHVADMPAAVAFYERLGGAVNHGDRNGEWVLMQVGTAQIGLVTRAPDASRGESTVELNFTATMPLGRLEQVLRERGVTIVAMVVDRDLGARLHLETPDGMPVKIHQVEPELLV